MSNTCSVPLKVPGVDGYVWVTVEIDNGAAEELPDEFPRATALSLSEEIKRIIRNIEQ